MENTWEFDYENTTSNKNLNLVKGAHRERDRRSGSIEIVKYFKKMLDSMFLPMTSMEYLSAIFRQRGVPCLDSFTAEVVGSFRRGLGFDPVVTGSLRKILSVARWSASESCVTMWLIEPVVSSVLVRGNSVDLESARSNGWQYIDVIEPLTMSTRNTAIMNNEMRGRWAGWMIWNEVVTKGRGNPSCVHCNLSGTSLMFMIRNKVGNVKNMMLTPESVVVMSAYSKNVCASMDMTSSLLASTSTKLKIQPSLEVSRATCLTVYGNGSVQVCGSPLDIASLVECMLEIVKVVMDTEMVPFLETMRSGTMNPIVF